jgi:hypothetical protein
MNGRWVTAAGSAMAVFGLVGLLVGCSSSSGGARTDPRPAVPTFSASPRPTTVQVATTVPTSCDGVAAAAAVDKIVGHPLGGTANQVVGVPVSSIGRTARLDCYYGIPAANQTVTAAVLTIGVSTYTDAQSAQARVTSTINDARTSGSTITTIKVNGAPATLMVSTQNQALALSAGTRTVLVTAATGVLPKGDDTTQLAALAQLGLTAHS